MARAIIAGLPESARIGRRGLQAGIDPLEAIDQGFKPGMDVGGDGFVKGELFIPDLMMSGEAMKAAIAALEAELMKRKERRQAMGKVGLHPGASAGRVPDWRCHGPAQARRNRRDYGGSQSGASHSDAHRRSGGSQIGEPCRRAFSST
jgi:hypothetical protein